MLGHSAGISIVEKYSIPVFNFIGGEVQCSTGTLREKKKLFFFTKKVIRFYLLQRETSWESTCKIRTHTQPCLTTSIMRRRPSKF